MEHCKQPKYTAEERRMQRRQQQPIPKERKSPGAPVAKTPKTTK